METPVDSAALDQTASPEKVERIDFTKEYIDLLIKAGQIPAGSVLITGITPDRGKTTVDPYDVTLMKNHSQSTHGQFTEWPRLFNNDNNIVPGGMMLLGVPLEQTPTT